MSTKYRSGEAAKTAESLNDDDNDDYDAATCEEGLSISASYYGGGKGSAASGGPFSAILISMCPQNVLSTIKQIEESCQPDFRYDEFGFKVEVEDGPEESSSKILSIPFVEDPQSRLKWISFLEFSFNYIVEDLTWNKIDPLLPRSEKLASLVRAGIPHSLRPFIWPRLCGATLKRKQMNFTFQEIVKAATTEKLSVTKAIEKDLHRTLPSNACFMQANGTGIVRLRRILLSIAYLYPDVGYCQGMGVIVGTLLLFLEEEDTFWMMVNLIEDVLPANYFGSSLLGVQADQKCLQHLIGNFLPEVEHLLRDNDLELGLISLHWFLTLFSGVLHMKILLRVWDCFFYHGSTFLFQITLGMLRLHQAELLKCNTSAQLFNVISNLPLAVEDADVLLESAFSVAPSLNDSLVQALRKKHLAYLMVEQGTLLNPEADSNLPKQRVNRRKLKRSQSFVSQIFRPSSGQEILADMEDIRMKNVRQTELMVDLKDSILKVAKHFLAASQADQIKAILQPDYSRESHKKDLESFMSVHSNRRKRARALLDFERHDEDELGFRKNDIIIVVSQKDEHCWIGELNGLRGWFPAKFVELLDERTKSYSVAGDDAINEVISDLVRGSLGPTLKAIFEHGIKRSRVLGGPCHPWLFIEDVAKKEVQRDFDSVYSRLVLCKTFSLEDSGKVLTPEELLFRTINQINVTHDAKHAPMDVKLRSLICVGLNEQCLHLWFEVLCCSAEVVRKWYQQFSFIRSPAWVQVKCELRILSQFSFNLNPDWELGLQKELNKPLREGLRDMLAKHHLFSWNL